MHKQFILAALEQAWKGRGSCSPNPSVGAVAVYQDTIIASGRHRGVGSAHAEQETIEQLPQGLKGVTLYVTLEPCNHWGKTPPCVDAIIQYGIDCVVYSFPDPNPIVARNNTPKILQKHGIKVFYVTLPEVSQFYQSYQYWTQTKKPYITAKLAHTLNGKIAQNNQQVLLSNKACQHFTHTNRYYTDAILTTASTLMIDNPQLNSRLNETIEKKIILIIDSALTLPAHLNIFDSAKHCHIFYNKTLNAPKKNRNCTYHALAANYDKKLNLEQLMHYIGQDLGFHDVWVEAGGQLFTALHLQNLVQKTYLYIVPTLLNEPATSGFCDSKLFDSPHTITWQAANDNMIACLEWDKSSIQTNTELNN